MFAQAEVAEKLYLIGDPDGGWSPDKGAPCTKTADGVFTIDCKLDKMGWFAFVSDLFEAGDWTSYNAHRYGPVQKGIIPEMGVAVDMQYGQDASFCLNVGEYTFVIDTNTMTFTATGQAEEEPMYTGDLYFRGDANGWGFSDEYKMTKTADGVYTINITALVAGGGFKLASEDWNTSFTTNNTEMEVGATYSVMNHTGENMSFKEAVADVDITLDLNTNTLTTAQGAGVATVAVEATTPVYYNLQGRRVANPEHGIFIEVRGTATTKVIK